MPSCTANQLLPHAEVSALQTKVDALFQALHRSNGSCSDSDRFARTRLINLALDYAVLPSWLLLNGGVCLDANAQVVGSGASAVVTREYRNSGTSIAVKRFLPNKVPMRTMFFKEAAIVESLRHQNIITILGVIDNPGCLAVVMPFLRNGDLVYFLYHNPTANRLSLAIGIARGLSYLKLCGIIHGDIKGMNILVDDHFNAIISDFGLATYEGECSSLPMFCGSGAGTPRYIAPERLLRSALPTLASDIFSFGMVLYEMFTGKIPYSRLSNTQATWKIINGIHPVRDPRIPDLIWSLALSCWRAEPQNRPPIEEVVDYLMLLQRKT